MASNQSFLQGGGEMGALTRAFDWSTTSIGSPENWAQSLQITLSIILSSKFPMFLWWGDDLLQFYNDAYRPSLGNQGKHPKALGQKGKDCWPEIWDIIHPLIAQVRTTGEATWSEDQLIPIYRNGRMEKVYWTFGYSAIRDESGKVDGVLVVCNETTQKVTAVNLLRESESRFQNLVRDATMGIIVLMGERFIVQIVNRTYGLLIDRTVEELMGKPLFDIIPEAEPYFLELLDGVRKTGEPVYLYDHSYFVFIDGKKKEGFINIIYQPYKEKDGSIQGVLVLVQDVTEQVIARKKLEQSESRLRALITGAPIAITLFMGRELVIEMPNQAFINIIGKGSEIAGKPLRALMPDLATEAQSFLQILDDVYTTGKMYQSLGSQVTIETDGVVTRNYYNFTYTPLLDETGQVYAILDIAVDVTHQVLARQQIEDVVAKRTGELAALNLSLQRSNADLQQFAYIASHDLQEPLRKASTFSEMLERSLGKLEEKPAHYLAKINDSIARMITLVRNVLTYSLLSKENEAFARVDLNAVIRAVISDYELLIHQQHAVIVYDPLPTITANELQMTQLFGNLISNAIKFSRPEQAPVVQIKTSRTDGHYDISVSDNGIGFAQENAAKIFQIFQRLHSRDAYAGTGIGLALCKKICQNHHGDIYAAGQESGGASFHIILPVGD